MRRTDIPALSVYRLYMSKTVILSDEAYAALAQRKRKGETFSNVVLRLVSAPIETFGDLEKYLNEMEGPLFPEMEWIRRVRDRKKSQQPP